MTYLRTDSHRAGDKAARMLGCDLDRYTDFVPGNERPRGGVFFLVEDSKVEGLLKIKGIAKPRQQDPNDYMKCWKF